MELERSIVGEILSGRQLSHPIILCFSTGREIPMFAGPMARSPMPVVGMTFEEGFADKLSAAMNANPAVHDGAIMLLRAAPTHRYQVAGWSYRLFPPAGAPAPPNRGTAFNSCLAMSDIPTVDGLYLLAASGAWKFVLGKFEEVYFAP